MRAYPSSDQIDIASAIAVVALTAAWLLACALGGTDKLSQAYLEAKAFRYMIALLLTGFMFFASAANVLLACMSGSLGVGKP